MLTPKLKYSMHKSRAKASGIPFLLTFDEWWDIWDKSGHWDERGRNTGQYCMSRVNDIGPYAVGNVFIQTHKQNILDCQTRNKFPTGVNNPNYKPPQPKPIKPPRWEFTDTYGNTYQVYDAHKFAREHNLVPSTLLGVANGQQKSHKGWTGRRLP